MPKQKELPKNCVVMDNEQGVLLAYKDGVQVEGNFQTRYVNKQEMTVEFSKNGKVWDKVPYIEKGKAKFDKNYDPEFEEKEQRSKLMVSPSDVRVIKGNV